MALLKKKKKGRSVHIDIMHLVKKMDAEYTEAFFDFRDALLRESLSDEQVNIIANIAIEQLQEGMAKKKKPSLIISKEKNYRTAITKMSKGQLFQKMKEKIAQQNYEKLTISGIWLVFTVCILLLFFKNLLTGHYLINFSIDLIAAALAIVLAVRNYQIRWRIIKQDERKAIFLSIDIITLVLCLLVKILVRGNFDVSYLLLVIAYFVTKKIYRKKAIEK